MTSAIRPKKAPQRQSKAPARKRPSTKGSIDNGSIKKEPIADDAQHDNDSRTTEDTTPTIDPRVDPSVPQGSPTDIATNNDAAPVAEPDDSAQPPAFIVEASLAGVVVPKLNAWLDDLSAAAPRVTTEQDDEAVHDLRVSLRRIRSLLRVVRSVFGRFFVARIRDDMRRVAAATGALRDAEVLSETLDALDLPQSHRKALSLWVRNRKEKELRKNVIELLTGGALEGPQRELRALLTLPVRPGHDKEAHRFARRVVTDAQKDVDTLHTADVADVARMHNLRIAYKRLRYAVEALGPVLPPELRAWGQVAAGFQKVLGSLHDHDVALEAVQHADDLPKGTRIAVVAALTSKRAEFAQRYLEAVGFEVRQGG